jgi:hypothetical protein
MRAAPICIRELLCLLESVSDISSMTSKSSFRGLQNVVRNTLGSLCVTHGKGHSRSE